MEHLSVHERGGRALHPCGLPFSVRGHRKNGAGAFGRRAGAADVGKADAYTVKVNGKDYAVKFENGKAVVNGKTKVEAAYEVGKAVAEKAVKLGIKKVVFDRSGYVYTGRVQKLAEGARSAGLEF